MEFAATATDTASWEAGRIMRTSGLSTAGMNDLLVELEEQNGERWTCLLLAYTDGQEERNAIKPANLVDPPAPSAETLQQCEQLVQEHTRLLQSNRLIESREKLVLALTNNPTSGELHNRMGDFSHKTGLPPATIAKYMRRAVANTNGTLEDKKRAFSARVGYSGSLGNMDDLEGEQQQLELLIDQCQGELSMMVKWLPTLLILLADSSRMSNTLDKVFDVLQTLKALPRPFPTIQFDIEEELTRNSSMLGNELYKIGLTLEAQAAQASDEEVHTYIIIHI
jgi:hypothetical protein